MELGPLPLLPLDVRLQDGSVIPVIADRFGTVFSLKERLAPTVGLYPTQQRLIYAGKLLSDDLSLDFYDIPPGGSVYFLPHPRIAPVGDRLYHLLKKLVHLFEELPTVESRRFTDIVQDAREILANPTLQASARIDTRIKQLLADAEQAISGAKRPVSRRSRAFLALGQDLGMDAYEAAADGVRTLRSMLPADDDDDDSEEDIGERTNVSYRKRMGNQPLPNPWASSAQGKGGVFHVSALRLAGLGGGRRNPIVARSPTVRARFSEQVEALKDMGFNDETVILEALTETNGNVQLAANLLRNHEPCK